MRSPIVELFRLLYTLTGAGRASFVVAILLVSVLDVCVLNGLFILLRDVAPTGSLVGLFKFPIVFATGTAIFFLNYRFTDKKLLEVVTLIKTRYIKVLIYTIVALMLVAYVTLQGKLF